MKNIRLKIIIIFLFLLNVAQFTYINIQNEKILELKYMVANAIQVNYEALTWTNVFEKLDTIIDILDPTRLEPNEM